MSCDLSDCSFFSSPTGKNNLHGPGMALIFPHYSMLNAVDLQLLGLTAFLKQKAELFQMYSALTPLAAGWMWWKATHRPQAASFPPKTAGEKQACLKVVHPSHSYRWVNLHQQMTLLDIRSQQGALFLSLSSFSLSSDYSFLHVCTSLHFFVIWFLMFIKGCVTISSLPLSTHTHSLALIVSLPLMNCNLTRHRWPSIFTRTISNNDMLVS